jgi:uncharacterized protein YjbJ (UPF0337 family)
MRGQIREQWGKLTEDDLDVIGGRRDQLIGLIQRRYGAARDEAESQVEAFEAQLDGLADDTVPPEERESWTRQQAGARQGAGGRQQQDQQQQNRQQPGGRQQESSGRQQNTEQSGRQGGDQGSRQPKKGGNNA